MNNKMEIDIIHLLVASGAVMLLFFLAATKEGIIHNFAIILAIICSQKGILKIGA
jgi:hypothetical protein